MYYVSGPIQTCLSLRHLIPACIFSIIPEEVSSPSILAGQQHLEMAALSCVVTLLAEQMMPTVT